MDCFYTDIFVLPLPETHRFPMTKYSRLRERLVECGIIHSDDLKIPDAANDDQLLRAHTHEYLTRVKSGTLERQEIRRIGFPWSLQMVERSRRSVGATISACESAFHQGIGVNLAGGTHHSFSDRGQGYCVFNDAMVAARHMQSCHQIKHVMIIDCDVHQGNGTAAIAADDASIFTFSIHGARNFPARKEQSDLDVPLPDETGDEHYADALSSSLDRTFSVYHPDLVIYLAGADPFIDDQLGRLSLSKQGLLERDRLVLERCSSMDIPVAVTMAGGYARDVNDIVDIHTNTIRLANDIFS